MCEDLPLLIKLTARKVILSKFNFFILKLQGFTRLFAAMACVNLVFPPQKLNSNEGDLMRLFIFSSVVQLTVQLSKLKGLGKTH